jgi:hypothetical protein
MRPAQLCIKFSEDLILNVSVRLYAALHVRWTTPGVQPPCRAIIQSFVARAARFNRRKQDPGSPSQAACRWSWLAEMLEVLKRDHAYRAKQDPVLQYPRSASKHSHVIDSASHGNVVAKVGHTWAYSSAAS